MSDPMNAALTAPTASATSRPCPNCGRDWGLGIACQFCSQVAHLPNSVRLSSPGKRLGAHLLDAVLSVVTLFIGWLIWSLIVWSKGQSPAKQLLGMKVVRLRTTQTAGWGTMCLREVILKPIGGFVAGLTIGILYFMPIWDSKNQELWDKMSDTIVVDDEHHQLA